MRRSSDDTTMATNFKEKVQILREQFFPSLQTVEIENISTVHYPSPPLDTMKITQEEVAAAIRKPKPDKAPGVNKIPNRFLRQVLEIFLPHFTRLFQACINYGYPPKEFRIANTIILKKPRKEDYSLAGSYRPIALLNTLGKALETILAQRLSTLAENNNLLPAQQMGARRGKSTKTALELLVKSVHTIWDCNRKNMASLLSLDVVGAFDHVSHPRLLHNLRVKGILEYILK